MEAEWKIGRCEDHLSVRKQ